MHYKTTSLKPHPVNDRVYGVTHAADDLVKSVLENGILETLAVKQDGTIISGHRRWQAALKAGLETVPVRIVEFQDELAEREAIIEHNRQREKTFSQKMAEAEEIKAIESERAKARISEAVSQANATRGKDAPTVEKLPQLDSGKTRDRVAEHLGVSGRTAVSMNLQLQRWHVSAKEITNTI